MLWSTAPIRPRTLNSYDCFWTPIHSVLLRYENPRENEYSWRETEKITIIPSKVVRETHLLHQVVHIFFFKKSDLRLYSIHASQKWVTDLAVCL